MAEKELFIIKIAHKGENKFDILNVGIIFDKVKVIVEHFKDLLLANNCRIDHLKEEHKILFDHFSRYISKSCTKMLV